MAELEILQQKHLIKATMRSLIDFLSKNIQGYNMGPVKYLFSEKKTESPVEGYNRACEGYNSFIEVFNIRDFDIG